MLHNQAGRFGHNFKTRVTCRYTIELSFSARMICQQRFSVCYGGQWKGFHGMPFTGETCVEHACYLCFPRTSIQCVWTQWTEDSNMFSNEV